MTEWQEGGLSAVDVKTAYIEPGSLDLSRFRAGPVAHLSGFCCSTGWPAVFF
jgi:hypothetical protein